jgi:hypothetical protein
MGPFISEPAQAIPENTALMAVASAALFSIGFIRITSSPY